MSDIKPGDLVMVVKPKRCCGGGSLGLLFTAGSSPFRSGWLCTQCQRSSTGAVITTHEGDGWVIEVDRVKKIDPLTEDDSLPTRRDLEVTA